MKEVVDNRIFTVDEENRNVQYEYEACCEKLRTILKPDQAEMIIAIHLDGMTVQEYAAKIGDKSNNVSHRLKRTEKKLREILTKTSF
jgi:DNA-directed RNA polymerase specialized sigma24 family protein